LVPWPPLGINVSKEVRDRRTTRVSLGKSRRELGLNCAEGVAIGASLDSKPEGKNSGGWCSSGL